MNGHELEYCLKRARDEARKAGIADNAEAASVHRSLSMRYSARALLLTAAENEGITLVSA